MANRTLQQWFDEYGEGHRNPVNITVHWVAVPLIYFSMVGLLMAIPAPAYRYVDHYLWAFLAMGAVWIFYMQRSFSIAIGMVIFNVACLWAGRWLDQHAAWPLWAICLSIFVLAWIAQFIGHGVEGKKPSFLKDLLFLLIGPAWLMAKLYRRLGIAY
ncbi:MAG: DUF962 domain-containing protein [Bacteroidetes bacterium]|nr:DUF962 domain-containing protein [Bacteroidota bacterium]MBS1940092.1 DUF962 domain-containing protein [Bacteroidota bacterium]